MPEDVIDVTADYQGALGDLEKAKTAVEGIVKAIEATAEILENWRLVNAPPNSIAQVQGTGRLQDFEPTGWPTGQGISQALGDYHRAVKAADIAWRSLPEDRKIGFKELQEHF